MKVCFVRDCKEVFLYNQGGSIFYKSRSRCFACVTGQQEQDSILITIIGLINRPHPLNRSWVPIIEERRGHMLLHNIQEGPLC